MLTSNSTPLWSLQAMNLKRRRRRRKHNMDDSNEGGHRMEGLLHNNNNNVHCKGSSWYCWFNYIWYMHLWCDLVDIWCVFMSVMLSNCWPIGQLQGLWLNRVVRKFKSNTARGRHTKTLSSVKEKRIQIHSQDCWCMSNFVGWWCSCYTLELHWWWCFLLYPLVWCMLVYVLVALSHKLFGMQLEGTMCHFIFLFV